MKKVILLLSLLLLFLVSCSKTTINAKMYQLKDWEYGEKVDDYKYEILDTYSDYETSKNMPNLKAYEEDYFKNSSLIIIYLRDSTYGNSYELKEACKINDELKIRMERVFEGLGQSFSTTAYCIEVESKNISMVEVNRVKMNQE